MTIKPWLSGFTAGALLMFSVLALGHHAIAQDEGEAPGRRVAEIHQACLDQGCPVGMVYFEDGRYCFVLQPGAPKGALVHAEQIAQEVLSRPDGTHAVASVEDALVILRFDPNHKAANRVIRQRYRALKKGGRSSSEVKRSSQEKTREKAPKKAPKKAPPK